MGRLALVILLLACPNLWAQPASLVKDIVPSQTAPGGPGPHELAVVNGKLFFSAEDPSNGRELWVSDGTPAGTHIVRDIFPGKSSSVPTWLTDVGGTLFFGAYDGVHGLGLWKSDGTATGTRLVRRAGTQFNPDSSFYSPEQLIAVGGTLFLVADGYPFGLQLWKSDGTEAGTVMVRNISGPFGALPHYSGGVFNYGTTALWGGPYLANVGGTVYFAAGQDYTDLELWKSDGTEAGTVLVKDIQPGLGGSSPSELTAVGGTLYFYADDGVSGRELWKSDGTAAGTTLVADICTGSCGAQDSFGRLDWMPGHLAEVGGNLYFVALSSLGQASLWKTDGTPGGTVFVKDIPGLEWQPKLTAAGGLLYFVANDPNGPVLWRSDGTDAGTFPLFNASSSSSYEQRTLVPAGADLFYLEEPLDLTAPTLWKTDGTVPGTVLLASFSNSSPPFPHVEPVRLGSSLFLRADDGTNGPALWKSDGTPQGTVMVKDPHPGLCVGPSGLPDAPCGSSAPINTTDVAGTLLFSTLQQELWRSDGSGSGTSFVKDLTGNCASMLYCPDPTEFTTASSRLFFGLERAPDPTTGLWTSDGTPAGTTQVLQTDFFPVSNLTDGGGPLFLQATAPQSGLWRSDGTQPGTTFVAPFPPDPYIYTNPSDLTMMGGTLFMFGDDGSPSGWGLWRSDGTQGGTALVSNVNSGGDLTVVGNELFFRALQFVLAKSDGTGAGTVGVVTCGFACRNLTAVGGLVYFTASDYFQSGDELWRSDGTTAGSYRVADIWPGPESSTPEDLTDLGGGVLLFTANDGVSGREPWRSDGTPAGTYRLRDIAPGGESSWVTDIVPMGNGRALFAASDPEHGRELWMTDGTTAGTFRLQDISPGPGSSDPSGIATSGSHVFLAADDGVAGRELWALDAAPAAVDLSLAKTAAPEPVLTGGTLVYTLSVTNVGNTAATAVTLTDTLPGKVTFMSSLPGAPTCDTQGGLVTCSLGTLALSASAVVTITVTVDLATGLLTNTASVTSFEADLTPADNTATATTTVSPADLSLGLQGAPDPAVVGGSIDYTLTVTNQGPVTATGVTGTLTLAPALSFVSGSPGCAAAGGTVTCALGTLSPASGAVAVVTASVGPSTLVTSSGVASADQIDPQSANNSATVTTAVTGLTVSEMVHGSIERHDLAAGAGPTPDRDFYRIGQAPQASYEVVVDGVSGDLGPAGPELRRVAPDGVTTIQDSVLIGGRSSRALRWENGGGSVPNELIDVRSLGCSTGCTPADAYRIRAWETTGRISRFNNAGSQVTVLVLQNPTARAMAGTAWFRDAAGALLASQPFALPARSSYLLNTSSVPALAGASGTITVTSDAGYGELSGKAVALEPATGFTFDSPLVPRGR